MTYLVVEDGTGVTGANGYVSLSDCADYCSARGLTFASSPSDAGEQAIIRATASLDAQYRGRFNGYKTSGRSQNLEWPRTAAFDAEGYDIASDEIPQEVINATCELAAREFDEANSTNPDIGKDAFTKRMKAGSVEIEYGANVPAVTVFSVVDGILAGLLGSAQASFVGTAIRG